MLQNHGGSSGKLRVFILAPTGLASININGTTISSAFGIPCCAELYPLDSNTLASLRNEFSEVQLIIVDNISKVSEKVFYQIHQRLIEIYQSGFISWLFAAKDLHLRANLSEFSRGFDEDCLLTP